MYLLFVLKVFFIKTSTSTFVHVELGQFKTRPAVPRSEEGRCGMVCSITPVLHLDLDFNLAVTQLLIYM